MIELYKVSAELDSLTDKIEEKKKAIKLMDIPEVIERLQKDVVYLKLQHTALKAYFNSRIKLL